MKRAALFCAGRGSYTEAAMGTIPKEHPKVVAAEALRAEYELPSLLELDGAPKIRASLHMRPANVSALIYLITCLDADEALKAHDVVCIGGNSMGWYSALAVAGALSFEDGFRLVQEMSLLQEEQAKAKDGGQIIYPLVGDDWRADPELERQVDEALASSAGAATWSIHLGGMAVLAGTEKGIAHLTATLPPATFGKNTYPFRLVQHGPYHTALQEPVSRNAHQRLNLAFRAPAVTLIDGDGRRHTPATADPKELRDYTFGAQVTAPYNFTASVRAALREYAPEALVLPGPGNTLGSICGQICIAEGYRGTRSRDDFKEGAGSELLISMRR